MANVADVPPPLHHLRFVQPEHARPGRFDHPAGAVRENHKTHEKDGGQYQCWTGGYLLDALLEVLQIRLQGSQCRLQLEPQ